MLSVCLYVCSQTLTLPVTLDLYKVLCSYALVQILLVDTIVDTMWPWDCDLWWPSYSQPTPLLLTWNSDTCCTQLFLFPYKSWCLFAEICDTLPLTSNFVPLVQKTWSGVLTTFSESSSFSAVAVLLYNMFSIFVFNLFASSAVLLISLMYIKKLHRILFTDFVIFNSFLLFCFWSNVFDGESSKQWFNFNFSQYVFVGHLWDELCHVYPKCMPVWKSPTHWRQRGIPFFYINTAY